MLRKHFWEAKTLAELSPREWERLCDGCALCCLQKIQDAKTKKTRYLHLACALLNIKTCRCKDYKNRFAVVPTCAHLTPKNLRQYRSWLPSSCAYRLLSEGKPLPSWHPLRTGQKSSTREAGMSALGRV